MTEVATRLKDELLRLSEKDRAALAHILIDSLNEKTNGENTDEENTDEAAEVAWEAELNRRSEELKSGQVVGIPADVVFARLREKRA